LDRTSSILRRRRSASCIRARRSGNGMDQGAVLVSPATLARREGWLGEWTSTSLARTESTRGGQGSPPHLRSRSVSRSNRSSSTFPADALRRRRPRGASNSCARTGFRRLSRVPRLLGFVIVVRRCPQRPGPSLPVIYNSSHALAILSGASAGKLAAIAQGEWRYCLGSFYL
jgi:hypothetical protein